MIRTKDGYAKLISTYYNGQGSRLLASNGGDVGYSSENIVNNIVQRNASGHIYANYYQSNINDESLSDIGSVYVRNTSDNFIRRVAKGQFYNLLGGKFVTLDTSQTISGIKTFSQQIKSTVKSGSSPFVVSSPTLVRNLNSDLLDDWQLADIVKSGYITSGTKGLASYWGKVWEYTVNNFNDNGGISLYVHSAFQKLWGILGINIRLNGSETSKTMDVNLAGIVGNIPSDRFRLYYDVATGLCQLWCNVNSQWGCFNYLVLSKTRRTTVELRELGTFYSTDFTTVQNLPDGNSYKNIEYLSIGNNSSTSTKLQTPKNINGTAFDGTENITTSIWGTTRTISLTGAITGSVSTNGGANITIATTYGTGNITNLDNRYLLKGSAVNAGNNSTWLSFANNSGGIGGGIGNNDVWRICGRAVTTNSGYLEIATADDGNEPIYIRQYSGVFTTIKRTLALLNENGNTVFPGIIQTTAININSAGPITWNAGSVQQRIAISDNTTSNDPVFIFQQSTDNGQNYTTLASIYDNGIIHSNGFVKTGGTKDDFLKADGSTSNGLDRLKIANDTDVNTLQENAIYWIDTDANTGTLKNSAFAVSHSMLQLTNYIQGNDYRRSRLAFNGNGELRVFDDRNTPGNGGTWYDVLTSENYSTIIGLGNYYTKSEADSRFVNVTGDSMTGALKFNATSGIGFSSTGTGSADTIGTAVKIHLGEDGATQDKANLRIGSWYGVGWYPTIENYPVAKGKHAMWLNVRTGQLNVFGRFEAGDKVVAGNDVISRNRVYALKLDRDDKIALFQSSNLNRGGLVLTDTGGTEHVLYLTTSNLTWKGRTVWDAGNDGQGSGLDADLLDGKQSGNATNNIPVNNGNLNVNLNAQYLNGVQESGFIRKWDGDYQRYTKVLTFTRDGEKGWIRLSIYTSSNGVVAGGGEYIIGWSYDGDVGKEGHNAGLATVECLLARNDFETKLSVTRDSANTFTIWFDSGGNAGKPCFTLLGHRHANNIKYIEKEGSETAPENPAYTSKQSNNISRIKVTQHLGNDINYPVIWSNNANTTTGYDPIYKSVDKFWFNPSSYKLYAAGGFAGNADSATNADKLDGVHLNGLFTEFISSGTTLKATIGGVSKTVSISRVLSADKLTTARKLWGQSFDGTKDISGNITVNGDIAYSNNILLNDNRIIFFNYYTENSLYIQSKKSSEGGGLTFCKATNKQYTSSIGFLSRDGELTLGSGTLHAGYKLWAEGNINVTGNATLGKTITQMIESPDGRYVDIKSPNHGIAFYSKGSIKAVIENTGNFGIGTSSPTQKLHVAGNILSNGYIKSGSSDSYVLLGGGGHKALSDLATTANLSKYVPLQQSNTVHTSDVKPYNYIHLFRIANSTGYSTAMVDIEIKARYGRIRLYIDIKTNQHPYGNKNSTIYITKEPWLDNWSSKRIYYKLTETTSGYNYYDVYLESGAWNSGDYGIVQKSTNGTIVYEPKGTNLDSLPSGCIEVKQRQVDASTISNLKSSNFYNEFKGNKWYHLQIDNSNTSGSKWYKVCTVKDTGAVPDYSATKVNGYLYDHTSNWESSYTNIIPFQIVFNLSSDTVEIYSTILFSSNKLRVLKIGTRHYELQFSTYTNHLDSDIFYTYEGRNSITCYTELEEATATGQSTITQCAQLDSYGNRSYRSDVASKLGSSTVGSSMIPIYLNNGSPTACSSSRNNVSNSIAVRDGDGDIKCRSVRTEYADDSNISGGIVYRANNTDNNYLRCCSNVTNIRTWLGVGAKGDYVTALGTNGNNLTWTKNGATNNITIPYATNANHLYIKYHNENDAKYPVVWSNKNTTDNLYPDLYQSGSEFYYIPGSKQLYVQGGVNRLICNLTLKFNSGATEGTDLYTFNGVSNKAINIKAGANIQFSADSGSITISSTNTTYSLVGANGSTGLIKNGSSVTSSSGYTACPIISGIPYYKDTHVAVDSALSSTSTNPVQNKVINTALSNKQAIITGGATTITSSNLIASRVLVSNSSGKVAVSSITSAELGYLNGVTSGIQTQINSIKYNWLWYQGKSSGSVTDNPGNTYGAIINGNCPKDSVLKGVYATYNDTDMSAEDLIADSANTIITIKSSGGNYFNQLMIAQRGRLFTRSFANQTVTETKGWNVVPLCSAPQIWNAYQDFRGGAGNSGSDMRFKKEVQNVSNILSKINDLNVIKYIWEHPDESQVKYTFGIDANKLLELGGIFATMVHSRNDKHDTKWVEYDRFGVLAIKAIQELCQTIQQMKNRIEILENKICLNSI